MLLQSARDTDSGQHSFQQPALLSFLCLFLVAGEFNFPSSIHLGPEPLTTAQCSIAHLCTSAHKALQHRGRSNTDMKLVSDEDRRWIEMSLPAGFTSVFSSFI